ncbi:MAG TPA: DedA family protein, partial [Micromonosporaceae bacterium]|nr:DedA family protein [Micromonosporaceae bacterium]
MSEPGDLGGLTGWAAGVIEQLGEPGVGLLVALETIVPPIPSEMVLALAGYLDGEGRVHAVLVVLAATVGSVLGALVLYGVGRAAGMERLRRWLDKLPLVDSEQLDKADRWFDRYGSHAVLFGRMVPVVRSLVSIPAGADRMPLPRFLTLTTVGSGVWNSLFVGLGYALGSQWQRVEQYGRWFDLAILVTFAVMIALWVVRRVRSRPGTGTGTSA